MEGGAIKYDARRTKKEHNETCGGRDEEGRDKEDEEAQSRGAYIYEVHKGWGKRVPKSRRIEVGCANSARDKGEELLKVLRTSLKYAT